MDKLAAILANMLRSALEWEKVNGCPVKVARKDELTDKKETNILPPPATKEAGEKR